MNALVWPPWSEMNLRQQKAAASSYNLNESTLSLKQLHGEFNDTSAQAHGTAASRWHTSSEVHVLS